MNQQLNVRISPETRRQLNTLTALYGETESQVITRLIDREYMKGDNAMLTPVGKSSTKRTPLPLRTLAAMSAWSPRQATKS